MNNRLIYISLLILGGCEIFEEQNINMTMIRYHWNSPDPTDPMYHYNPTDVELRRNMYNVLFCPVAIINGVHVRNGAVQVQNNAHGDVLNENTSKKIRLEKSNVEKILRQSALEKSPISVLKNPKTIVSATVRACVRASASVIIRGVPRWR